MALEPHSYSGTQTANNLWFRCCKDLQNNLQSMGITVLSTEAEILEKVRDLTVKTVNLQLNLCDFFKMAQKEVEGVHQYVARLRGAANLCDFMVGSCTETVSKVTRSPSTEQRSLTWPKAA